MLEPKSTAMHFPVRSATPGADSIALAAPVLTLLPWRDRLVGPSLSLFPASHSFMDP
jgi:hypothetical protein